MRIDLTGKKFDRLTVISFSHRKRYQAHWVCLCLCGTQKTIRGHHLSSGKTKSCGCIRKEVVSSRRFKHGMSRTNIYHKWNEMKRRCEDPDHMAYPEWGGRGITVSKEWMNFDQFYKDIGDPPSRLHSLGRINNDKGYSAENCRWETAQQQAWNRRSSRLLTFNGLTKCIAEWAKDIGIGQTTLRARIESGWTTEKAILTPLRLNRNDRA